METNSVDYNVLAGDYAQNRSAHPLLLARLISPAPQWLAPRVLEIGCGTCNYIGRLQMPTGCAAYGVDPSSAMLAAARARWPAVVVEEGRGENLPYVDGEFDYTYCVDVIHHVRDAATMIREAYRVLAPQGLFAVATDSERIIATRCPLAVYWPETVALELQRYHPIAELLGWLVAAGFIDLREETVEYAYSLESAATYRVRAFSSLQLLPDEVFARGLAKLEADLVAGPVPCVSRYTLLWARKPAHESV
ncbi:MAG: class I SAM-dependent methyltransferase [Anaerolineales bacterium]|nr:class I SAM-dependent methyltransferase [Anaerolineales bacterium]